MDARRINYYGPPGTFPRISVVDIINGRYPADFFKERIVLVGVTAAGLEAGVLTPFTQHRDQMNGVEAHAHILNNLIDRNSLVDVPDTVRWVFSCASPSWVSFSFCGRRGKRAALLWVLGMAAVSAAAFAVFTLFQFGSARSSPASSCRSCSLRPISTGLSRPEGNWARRRRNGRSLSTRSTMPLS